MQKTVIHPIPAFTDNYIWCLHNHRDAYVVDPGDASPVFEFLNANGLTLRGILITHHHTDHIGGVKALLKQYPNILVTGPVSTRIPGVTIALSEGDSVELPELNTYAQVMEVPAHTTEHIAYLSPLGLFCGDTMFSGGCGRLFEGTPEQMQNNFHRFKQLPEDTLVYCTHEYTQANVDFALAISPENQDLLNFANWVKTKRDKNKPTLPSTIATELKINPYMREEQPDVIAGVEKHWQVQFDSPLEVFSAIRRWKDNF